MTLTFYTVIGYLLMAGICGAVILGLVFWFYVGKWLLKLLWIGVKPLFKRSDDVGR